MATLVGVISDTHGMMRPEALKALAGVGIIIHAGDVGKREVLEALETIAPVLSIKGNVDTSPWAHDLPATRTVEIEQVRIYILHSLADLDFDPAAQGYGAVISGHSHKPNCEFRSGMLYLNPGSAGPKRFRLPVTLARILVDGQLLDPEIITLMAS